MRLEVINILIFFLHNLLFFREIKISLLFILATACIPYWPTKTGATVEVGNGFKITNLSSATHEDAYTTTTLKLTHTPSKKTRTIWHLQYIGKNYALKNSTSFC